MAIIYTPQILCQEILDTAGSDVYYANNKTVIKELAFCNYSASPVGIDIMLIPSGGTPGNQYLLEKNLLIDADKTTRIALNTVMAINSRLFVTASIDNSVTLTASGVDTQIV